MFGAFSAALLLQAVLAQALGRLVDRLGGRVPLIVSSLVFAAGLVALGLSQNPVQFVAAWLVMGLGMALGLYDIAFAGLVGWFGVEARRPITGVTLIAGFASTIGWPLTAWLQAEVGWRGACFAWAAIHLLLTLPLHLSLPRQGRRETTAPAAHAEASGPPASLKKRVLVAIAFAAMAAVGSAISAHLPRLLAGFGATPGAAIAAGALVGPAQVAARLAEFVVVRRVHPLTSARVSIALFPVGAGLLVLGGPAFAAPFAILYGCGNGLFTIARGSLPLALFGTANYGARLGAISIPGRVLQALAPLAVALVMQGSVRWTVILLAGLCGVGLACLMLIQAPHSTAEEHGRH